MGQGSFSLCTSHDPKEFLTSLLDRLPAGVAALFTAERTGVWSQYFTVVVVQDWQREGQHRPTLVGLLRRLWSKPNGTRTPPPVLVVSFELQGASITAHEQRRELLDLVCPSFALADGCPTAPKARELYVYELRSVVLYALGHFVALLRKDNRWFLADDHVVTEFSSLGCVRGAKVSPSGTVVPSRAAGFLTVRSH